MAAAANIPAWRMAAPVLRNAGLEFFSRNLNFLKFFRKIFAKCLTIDISYERNLTAKRQQRKFETNIPRKGIARGLSPSLHIHVSVSDLFIPTIGLPILLQENMWPGSWEYTNRSQAYMNVELETEAAQFLFWKYIYGIFVAVIL